MEFVRAMADDNRDTVFLIENNYTPIGMVGVDWREPEAPELGYWLGVEHWGQGFATEAARAVIDFTFEEFEIEHLCRARASPTRRRATSWRNAASSGAASSCIASRRWARRPRSIASALAQRLVVAEELEQFDAHALSAQPSCCPAAPGPTAVGCGRAVATAVVTDTRGMDPGHRRERICDTG